MDGKQTPLIDQLITVPIDARLVINDSDGMGSAHFAIGRMCHEAAEILRTRLAQPEPEREQGDMPCIEDDGCPTEKAVLQRFWRKHRQPEPEPVAWVENLTDAQPHAVTDLKYCSVAQHERGEHLKYIPLYADPTPCQTCEALARTVMMDQTSHDTAPPKREWQGLTDAERADIWNSSDPYFDIDDFARAIEAKLKEKNT